MKALSFAFIGLLSFGCAVPRQAAQQSIVPPTAPAVASAADVDAQQPDEPGMTIGEFLTSCATNADCPAAGELNAYKCVREGGKLGKCKKDKIEIRPRLAPGDEGKFCVRKETQGEYCEICAYCDSTGKYCGVSGSPDCWYPGYVDPQFISEKAPCPEGYVDTDSLKIVFSPEEHRRRQAYCGY